MTLLGRAIAAEQAQTVQRQNELFDELQNMFIETQAILRARILEAEQPDDDQMSTYSEDNERSFEENDENDHGEYHEENRHNPRDLAPERQPLQEKTVESQFPTFLQRMCVGLANKKDNTWGTYDGDLSQWQGFHDAFKKAVHDDNGSKYKTTIAEIFIARRCIRKIRTMAR